METVRICRLGNLPPSLFRRLYDAQVEAARVWSLCRDIHLEARRQGTRWPNRDDLQKATKGRFALHSQTVQMICHAFLANVETTRQWKRQHPQLRYPYKDKWFYPLLWPAQAIGVAPGRVVLPMGRGRRSVVLRVEVPENAGACKIVWSNGYELHVSVPVVPAEAPPGTARATADLGQIHQAAVTTDTGAALVVSGRGIRSAKRWLHQAFGEIAKQRSRCKQGSRHWRKLQRARGKVSARVERQVRDLRHKGMRKVVEFCKQHGVGRLYVGNPDGVRARSAGRHHNQRMSQWEYGRDIDYLAHKSEQSRIVCFTGTERGTSSRCPECGHRQRPKGRAWVCNNCGFRGHRDVVGSANMHPIAYGEKIEFPQRITYLRPGPVQGSGGGMKNCPRSQEPERSSCPDTGHGEGVTARLHPCCPGEFADQPPAVGSRRARASQEAGHTAEVA
ncbi:MAG: transposase [Deinococcus sp.]|nr:transposase [Deinococcus sp.]